MGDSQLILDALSSCILHNPSARSLAVDPGLKHRLNLCDAWGIKPGCALRVLDVGCGQGESSAVYAYVVGPNGHVTGIDPAPPTYGSPYTLQESQEFILKSELGSRITFVRCTAPDLLKSHGSKSSGSTDSNPTFDLAAFCHSLWYFPSREAISEQFAVLAAAGVPRVCFAEYTGKATSLEQEPHELAAQAQILLHRYKAPRAELRNHEANIRGALEPAELLDIAEGVGWTVRDSGVIRAPPDMRDGFWETQIVLSPTFRDEVLAESLEKHQEDEILAVIPHIQEAVDRLKDGGKQVETMDAFWAVLELGTV